MNDPDGSADEEAPTGVFLRPPSPRPGRAITNRDGPDMLTVKEAADFLRVNVKTIHKLLSSGALPHVRLGRVIRIERRVLLSGGKAA
jgi:excisionase family DNA binding protein